MRIRPIMSVVSLHGSRSRGGSPLARATVVAVALGVVAWGALGFAQATGRADDTAAHRPAPAPMILGITHNRESADAWNNPAAVARARTLIPRLGSLQNQHIMGWGALSPEPAPGVFHWGSLDARMRLIRSTRGTPVITLCCAPDWMKRGRRNETDWGKLEEAPAPEHFGDFAHLARRVAQRYPHVRYFQVWNELKGFYDAASNRWDYEAYTELYNQVYDALKSVNPGIQVGGPYVPMDSWSHAQAASHPSAVRGPWGVLDQRALDAVEYWLEHKHGADFVTVDGGTATKDRGLVTDPFTAAAKFAAVDAWLSVRTSLPIWWAEWYAPSGSHEDQRMRAAVSTASVLEMAASGARVALAWGPQGDGSTCGDCLWTDTRRADGGRPTPTATAFAALRPALSEGGPVLRAPASPADAVLGFHLGDRCFLINRTADSVAASCAGERKTLGPYAVGWAR
jgi:hypothetical protein